LKPILKQLGLPLRFRWYDCRHTCATLLLAAGENPKVVSERLGHTKVAFTLDRYGHVMPGMQEKASEKLEAILFGR
jgi:integrase